MRLTEQEAAELRRAYAAALYKLGYICALIGISADEDLEKIEAKVRADRAELANARRHLSGRADA
jgi:hypothetical protein